MKIPSPVRQEVQCSECAGILSRVIWHYPQHRLITEFFCDNTCKGTWQRKQKDALGFTRGWLVDQYITKAKSCNQIAFEIGRDPKSVWNWIVDYDIPTRPRGSNTEHLIKDGSAFRGKKHTPAFKESQRQRRLKDGHVPYLKNGVHWLKATGRRPASWKGGITPERQAFYATPEWANAVKAVWKRDDAKCQRCELDHRTIERGNPRFTIHHIDSFKIKERRADVSNLILLCQPCHHWTHSRRNTNRQLLGEGH